MREVYETPEMEVVYFEAEDVITTSPPYLGDDNDQDVGFTEWDN